MIVRKQGDFRWTSIVWCRQINLRCLERSGSHTPSFARATEKRHLNPLSRTPRPSSAPCPSGPSHKAKDKNFKRSQRTVQIFYAAGKSVEKSGFPRTKTWPKKKVLRATIAHRPLFPPATLTGTRTGGNLRPYSVPQSVVASPQSQRAAQYALLSYPLEQPSTSPATN